MDPSRYPELYSPTHEGLDHHQLTETHLGFEGYPPLNQYPRSFMCPTDHRIGTLHDQYTAMHGPGGAFPAGDVWHQFFPEHGALSGDAANPMGTLQIPYAYPLYVARAIQTDQSDSMAGGRSGEERPVAQRRPTLQHPVPQEAYKPTKQKKLEGLEVIEFIVNGEEGLRLSDASEENWVGLEGRDERSLFGKGRPQITIRLHFVGCEPWKSKISATDFTAQRRPITKTKLAAAVARNVSKFIAREKLKIDSGDHSQCRWGNASLKNVFLTPPGIVARGGLDVIIVPGFTRLKRAVPAEGVDPAPHCLQWNVVD